MALIPIAPGRTSRAPGPNCYTDTCLGAIFRPTRTRGHCEGILRCSTAGRACVSSCRVIHWCTAFATGENIWSRLCCLPE